MLEQNSGAFCIYAGIKSQSKFQDQLEHFIVQQLNGNVKDPNSFRFSLVHV